MKPVIGKRFNAKCQSITLTHMSKRVYVFNVIRSGGIFLRQKMMENRETRYLILGDFLRDFLEPNFGSPL